MTPVRKSQQGAVMFFKLKPRSRKVIDMRCGRFGRASKGRVLDAAERAAIEERLRSEGRL
jgi:hypothetical protein